MLVIKATKAVQETKENIETTTVTLRQRNEDLIKNNYEMAQEHMRIIKKLNDKLEELKKELIKREEELVKAKQDLINAQKELEAMETLKEKQAEEYYLEQNRIEQKESDEKATLKFTNELLKQQQNNEEG